MTLPDAAKYLSSFCDKEVKEADVLRLVLDEGLTLSVVLVNGIWAAPQGVGDDGSLIMQDKEWVSISGIFVTSH